MITREKDYQPKKEGENNEIKRARFVFHFPRTENSETRNKRSGNHFFPVLAGINTTCKLMNNAATEMNKGQIQTPAWQHVKRMITPKK